jgi:hypothetical protein
MFLASAGREGLYTCVREPGRLNGEPCGRRPGARGALIKAFGDEYLEYARGTRRLIPWVY